ncbi:MAG: [FeFe] hydrogenase H-cluster radical SAM maturase HydE [Bacteroidetes bacterium]|nr:MAG: [FeFe] hydrogenase H-cluster radical SAM maturase HydE [Bacteroidota bacterium]
MGVREILEKERLERADLITLLEAKDEEKKLLFEKATAVKLAEIGNKVHFRGLVEFSNICGKDCYYCGIRKSNKATHRYNVTDEQILDAARFAFENAYGSLVMQAGELESPAFTLRVENLLKEIKKLSKGKLGITLSLGEQSREVYERWFKAGAHRYLLRIETSNPALYQRYHPTDTLHDYARRLTCLKTLQRIGYQTGTGVMIGLPFQDTGDMADDLLFMKEFNIDMVGMGPYIEHKDTPLYAYRNQLLPIEERFDLALKMIATLRILMKDINIAAATALQAIDPLGREKSIKVGANIIMPNITPGKYRNDYALYENKPCVDEEPEECKNCLDVRIQLADGEIGYDEWGDSKHFHKRLAGE